jgi:hypothetical protein
MMTMRKAVGPRGPELSFVKKQNPLRLSRLRRTVERASRSRIRGTCLVTYTSRFVGIDISKSSFDICILPEGRMASFANTAAGIAAFIALVARLSGIERLVLEPTGGYERSVVEALLAARLPVAKVNAKQVRQFARACGQLSKTDRIDAFVLADYGRRMETKVLAAPSPSQAVLVDLVSRYRQLSHMIVQEKNRREKLTRQADGRTRAWIEESLRFLLEQRQSVVDEMTACLKSDVSQGHWCAYGLFPDGRPAGTGAHGQGADRQTGRGGAAQPGQRSDARQEDDRRWAKAGSRRPLYRRPAGNPLRSRYESPLRTAQGKGKTRKGRSRRRHA